MLPSLAAIDRHFERLVADLGPPPCRFCKQRWPETGFHICAPMWEVISNWLFGPRQDEWPIRAADAEG